ncbi:MAG: 1-hydroxycarotenoid 3,4-desaturase CrtD [Cyclobacteriaceae bacterium]
MKHKVGIIGAGIAGIAAAIRLANKGYEVTVYEANAYPGGKLSEIRKDGFRFDAGPSLFTLPEQVEELFSLSGEKTANHFRYQRLPVTCHYFYEDGTVIHAYADKDRFAREIYEKTGEPAEKIQHALSNSARLYTLLADLFMKRSIHQWQTFVNPQAFRAYINLHRLDFFRNMNQANESFFSDPRLVQLFNRYATYNGSNPYQTPATLNIIPHLEFHIGAFFPEEGMHSITLSLYELAKRLGVTFQFNAKVDKILLEDKTVKGVQVNGEKLAHELVVSNMDIVNTYKKLLSDEPQPKLLLNQPKSSSALIFYWGIRKTFDQLDLHNIFFSKDYQREFDHIFRKKEVYEDPTVYINITSKYKTDDAPPGCENWFTMINVPNNSGQDWDAIIDKAKQQILKKMSRMLDTDVASLIDCEEILDPRLIEQRTSSSMGALYGNSSNNKYAAFLRHANFSRKYKNLYFCGGSVHPGGGIPLSLLSARIATEQVPELR